MIEEEDSSKVSQSKEEQKDEKAEEIETSIDEKKSPSKERKLPCLFGFISSWIAKRKEKRRAKKKKAIEARKSVSPDEALIEYEHKHARGGESFCLKVDNRPMRMSVLPPIKRRPENAANGTDEKLKRAELRRSEALEKKKESFKRPQNENISFS